MIGYLKGKIIRFGKNFVILEANGVGYKIYLPNADNNIGSIVEFHVHHHVREEQSDLYGFADLEDLNFFELLLTVSGVGPKLAATITSSISSAQAIEAIKQGQSVALQAIPGVGAKVAAKITIELKGKIGSSDYNLSTFGEGSDLIDALHRLGYKNSEVLPILKNLPIELDSFEDKIRWVLKSLGKERI